MPESEYFLRVLNLSESIKRSSSSSVSSDDKLLFRLLNLTLCTDKGMLELRERGVLMLLLMVLELADRSGVGGSSLTLSTVVLSRL